MHPQLLKTLTQIFGFGLQVALSVSLALLGLRILRLQQSHFVSEFLYIYLPFFHLSFHLLVFKDPKSRLGRLGRVCLAAFLGVLIVVCTEYIERLHHANDRDPVAVMKSLLNRQSLRAFLHISGVSALVLGHGVATWIFNRYERLRPLTSSLTIGLVIAPIFDPLDARILTVFLASAPWGAVVGRRIQERLLASTLQQFDERER